MIAGHEADIMTRAERIEEADRRLELGRQADMRDVAGAGVMVRRQRLHVGDDQRQDFHVMGMATLAPPIDIARRPLAQQMVQRKPRERAEMRVRENARA